MTDAPDFGVLRRDGIAKAQEASGLLWTDFNLHDPGVTLLEQFCFAQTELEYRADFDVADLLASDGGKLDYQALGLKGAREVLPSAPVTPTDIALALTSRCPQVRRVLIEPGKVERNLAPGGARWIKTDRRGLYDIFVVPERGEDVAAAIEDVRRKFHETRNICEDIGRLEPAEAIDCTLHATVEVRRRHTPERVAALIYECCGRLMTDGAHVHRYDKVTRQEAFDKPELLLGQGGKLPEGAELLDHFFLALNELDEVKNVRSLAFEVKRDAGDGSMPVDPLTLKLGKGQYRTLVDPETESEVHLTLISRGIEMRFDLPAMLKELQRTRAETRKHRQGLTARAEWDQRPNGSKRQFPHDRVGESLPRAYRMSRDMARAGMNPEDLRAAAQLRSFLAFSDAPLSNANADLENLPHLFSASAEAGQTYKHRPFDFGDISGQLAVPDPKFDEIAAEFDPARDRKGRALEYLLALYGEHFAQNTLRLHDFYHGPAERSERVLQNRAAFLERVARMDHNRAGAVDYASERGSFTTGLADKLALLLGFSDLAGATITQGLDELELEIGGEVSGAVNAADLEVPSDPLSLLVPRQRALPEISHAELVGKIGLFSDKRLNARVFQRGAHLESYVLSEKAGSWQIYLDLNDDRLVPVHAGIDDRDAAIATANQVCGMMAALNARSEGLYLVEDVLLRGETRDFDPLSMHVVLPGWSARACAGDFRQLVAETVSLVCPAHIRHRLVWMDFEETRTFERLHEAWRRAYQAANNPAFERADAETLDSACKDLRSFLHGRVGS